ncbi:MULTISPECIES: hormogonium polysaccharide biosynthesis glycosyltransferase HpsP [unclassified Nodosilinea]|uniref:Hormogonium polysaccharide biosynthesis glycosyltransferase HpsP n=1 Tax=Leptolyngbya subtilissima DQ-A4 TaxID=2933933 RepID=A0ABV0KBJ5_9CYAN|nr:MULTISPECIES: hormogonium polysaccharide biosynthesis glycosyltransferase HpsP [unclassified Nodosilinea]MBD2106263.1 glycosyltransferase [Nodosilinea sp. FACHB-13]MBD2114868.1 glycosyltransferase [Nodosilinea sp. FACHB-141]
MRILQIVPSISLIYGGPSQMVRGFAQGLAAAGAEVTILTTNANGDSGQSPLAVPLGVPVQEENYTVRYFACSPWRRYKFSAGLLAWLYQHAHEFDLVHIHALFSPLSTAAATVARDRGLPYVLRPLGTLDPADLQKKKRLKQIYGRLFEAPNIGGAAALHFTSPIEAEVSYRFGASTQDWVIPLGVQPPKALPVDERQQILAQLGIPHNRPLLLYLSRLDPKKGLDLLLPALEQLTAQGVEFHLVLAGGNPQDPAYEQAIGDRLRATSLGDRTALTGFVTGNTKAALLQAADLFVLPSYYENFGIAVAEAMAAGVPVVVSKGVYIWPDITSSGSGWVCDLSVDGVAQALVEALKDSAQRQLRGQRARAYARECYDWDAIAHHTLAAYRSVLPKPLANSKISLPPKPSPR